MQYADIVIGDCATSCDQPLQIDDKNVGFLIEPLKEHCCFKQSSNRGAWCLEFFKGSKFERTVTVFFKDNPDALRNRRAWWIETEKQLDHQLHEDSMSRFLRGSMAKKLDDAVYHNRGTRLVVDREDMVLFCNHRSHFERIILCQALALAYKNALSTCMRDLTQCIKSDNETQLIDLYEDMLRFNTVDYFSHPVDRHKSHELYDIWEQLSQHWRLEELQRELAVRLNEQVSDLVALIRLKQNQREHEAHQKQQKEQQEKDRAFNRKAILISWLITAMSLLTLIQLTPATFLRFWTDWTSLFFN